MLLDVEAVAKELGGLGESTVRKLIREGRLPAVRVGRRVMVARRVLEDFIHASTPEPPREEPAP